MNKWYVLQVKTGRELDIRQTINIEIPECKAMVPRQEVIEKKAGKTRIVSRNLISGYVFVNTVITDEIYYKLIKIPCVLHMLRMDNKPKSVDDEEMSNILQLIDNKELVGISDVYYEDGRVKVISGPLKGMEGKITKVDKHKNRVTVILSIFNEPKIVSLSINVIQSLKD